MKRLSHRILNESVHQCVFLVPARPVKKILGVKLPSFLGKEAIVACRIDQSRYVVKDEYKIDLVPLDTHYADQTFYMFELQALLEHDGRFRFLVDAPEGPDTHDPE